MLICLPKLRWLMSPKRAQEWELYLMNQVIGKGGAVPENVYTQPVHIPTVSCPSISDDKIILTDPKNLVVVNTYGMKIRKTTEGKEAIMQDKRFYVYQTGKLIHGCCHRSLHPYCKIHE